MRFTEERFEAFLPRKDWKRGVDKVQKKVSWHDPEYVETEAGHREELGDFSTTLRVLPISALAVGIGVLCAEIGSTRSVVEKSPSSSRWPASVSTYSGSCQETFF